MDGSKYLFFILFLLVAKFFETNSYSFTTSFDNLETVAAFKNITFNSSSGTSPPVKSFEAGFISSFTVTALSEIGDKTFFIAVVLSLSNSVARVFSGAILALASMTVLSVGLGMMFSSIPSVWVHGISTILFLVFGLKMLKDGYQMSKSSAKEEFEEVKKTVDNKMANKKKFQDIEAAAHQVTIRWVMLEAFVMTFLAEWGDRSQIATVVLAAKHHINGVLFGAILAHASCTLLAVLGGKVVADRISLRTVTISGGFLFLLFAILSIFEYWEEIVSQLP